MALDPRNQLSRKLDNLIVGNMSARTDPEAEQAQASTGVTPESLKQKLEQQLGATYVEVEDMSGEMILSSGACAAQLLHPSSKVLG